MHHTARSDAGARIVLLNPKNDLLELRAGDRVTIPIWNLC